MLKLNFFSEAEEENYFLASGEPLYDDGLAPLPGENGVITSNDFAQIAKELPVTQWVKSKPFAIMLSCDKDKLTWRGGRALGGERKVTVSDLMLVSVGKMGSNFQDVEHPSDDFCLSILTKNEEYLSISCSSKLERESLAMGFSMLIDDNSASLRNLCVIN